MKKLQKLSLIISLLLFLVVTGHAQSSKLLVQSFDKQEEATLKLVTSNDNFEIIETNSSRIQIEIFIEINHSNNSILKYLVSQNRYQIQQQRNTKTGELQLEFPKLSKKVRINGTPIEEQLSFKIYVPKSTKYYMDIDNNTLYELLK